MGLLEAIGKSNSCLVNQRKSLVQFAYDNFIGEYMCNVFLRCSRKKKSLLNCLCFIGRKITRTLCRESRLVKMSVMKLSIPWSIIASSPCPDGCQLSVQVDIILWPHRRKKSNACYIGIMIIFTLNLFTNNQISPFSFFSLYLAIKQISFVKLIKNWWKN